MITLGCKEREALDFLVLGMALKNIMADCGLEMEDRARTEPVSTAMTMTTRTKSV